MGFLIMSRSRPPIIRHLVLWLTTSCNLSCTYCYRGNPSQAEVMGRDVVRDALRLAAVGGGPLHVQMAGGEPTLEPGLMETVAREARRLKVPVTLAVQTNGVALDPAMARLFKRWEIGVGGQPGRAAGSAGAPAGPGGRSLAGPGRA